MLPTLSGPKIPALPQGILALSGYRSTNNKFLFSAFYFPVSIFWFPFSILPLELTDAR